MGKGRDKRKMAKAKRIIQGTYCGKPPSKKELRAISEVAQKWADSVDKEDK